MDPRLDLITGINFADTAALEADTTQRLTDFFSTLPDVSKTMPEVPQIQYGALSNDGSNINIDLTTEQRNMLIRAKHEKLFENAQATALTLPEPFLSDQSQTRRYMQEDFGFNPLRDNEDFYAKQQGFWGELGKVFFKFPTYTVAKLGAGVGMLAGMLDPTNWGKSNYIAAATDNAMARAFMDLEDQARNEWGVTFQKAAAKDMGFFKRALGGDQTFWATDAVDAAAFMASAYVMAEATAAIGLGSKLAAGLGAGRAAASSSRLISGLGRSILNNADRWTTNLLNTSSEALFEAQQLKQEMVEDLVQKGLPREEAEAQAGSKAADSFKFNVAALALSGIWETNLFYKMMGKSAAKEARKDFVATAITDELVLPKTTGKLARIMASSPAYYAKKALEGIAVEGFYEENIQLAIERMNRFGDKGLLSQYFDQTIDAIKGNDIEASTSIGLGGLIGGLFGSVASMANKDYSKEKAAESSILDVLNTARNNWLGAKDLYKQDESGNWILDKDKMASVSYQQFKNSLDLQTADDVKNPHLASIVRKNAFASFVASHVRYGTYDFLQKQLESIEQLKPEQIAAMGMDPENNRLDQKQELINYAAKIKDIVEVLDSMPSDTPKLAARKEMLFEKAAQLEAIKEEITKASGRIGSLSAALGGESLSDNLVERLNALRQKQKVFELNKQKSQYKDFYDDRINALGKEITKVKAENAETLDKIKEDKDGFYKFENEDRNKNVFMSEYMQTLTDGAALSAAYESNQHLIDIIDEGGEEFDKMMEEEEKKVKDEMAAAVKKREEEEAEQRRKEEEARKSQQTGQTSPVDSKPDTTTSTPPADTSTPDVPSDKKDLPPARPVAEIMKDILPIGYMHAADLTRLSGEINRGYKAGTITKEEANELMNTIQSKEAVGTAIDHEDARIKDVALAFFLDKKLNPDQKSTLVNHYDAVKDEVNKIKAFMKAHTAPDNTEPTDTKPDTNTQNDPTDDTVDDNPTNTTQTSGDYDPNTADLDDVELELGWSRTAFESSLKTVTQEEDENTNRLIIDPYLQFKQKFLRQLLRNHNIEEFGAVITKDRAEFPHDQRAQTYLNETGDYGSVLQITNPAGEPLYFNENYEYITRDEWEQRKGETVADQADSAANYQPIIYSFTKDYWEGNKEERAAIRSERTGEDIGEILRQYDQEAQFLNLARQLVEAGYVAKVRLSHVLPGVPRRVAGEAEAGKLLAPFDYNLEIISEMKGMRYTIRDNRYLVNGALYAVVEQNDEPPFYVRLVPKRVAETELMDEITSLLSHTYTNEEEALEVEKYLTNLLYLKERRRYTLVVVENDGKFTFGFSNKGLFSETIHGINELLKDSRFNIDKASLEPNRFVRYKIEEGKLKREVIDYKEFLLKNTVTHNRPVMENGQPVFRSLNTYMIFTPDEANEQLIHRLNNNEEIKPIIPLPKEDPTKADDSSTLTSDKVKKRKSLNVPDNGLGKSLEQINEELIKKRRDDLNSPNLQAIATTEERALIGEDEIHKVNEMFGHQVLTNLSDIANAGIWGEWNTWGITLYKGAQEGTGYHEAWHHFSQLYLTKSKKRALYDELRIKNIRFTDRSGKKLTTKKASDFQIEEFIADDFRDYVLSNGQSRLAKRPQRNSIFRQIWEFLKNFFSGTVDIGRLYEQLYQGRLNRYKPSATNAMWGKLNAGIYNRDKVQIFDTVKASYYTQVIDALISQKLLDARGSIVNMQESLEYAAKMYKEIGKQLQDEYYNPLFDAYEAGQPYNEELEEDLGTLIENWPTVVDFHKTNTKLGYYIDRALPELAEEEFEHVDEVDQDQEDEFRDFLEENKEAEFEGKLFERSGQETNGSISAPEEIRALVRMLPAMSWDDTKKEWRIDKDHNGFPKLNEYSQTWNNLAYELNGSLSYTEMYHRLQKPEVVAKIPQASELLKRIPNPQMMAEVQDIVLATRFHSAFSRDYVGIYSGTFNRDPQKFYFVEETKRTTSLIERNWNNRFLQHDDSSVYARNEDILFDEEKDRFYLNHDKVLTYNFKSPRDTDYFLGLLGISFSGTPDQVAVIKRQLPSALTNIQNNINARHQQGQILYNSVLDLKSDYGRGENRIAGVNSTISLLSRLEALNSADVPSMSYQTAEGEMIYALQLRNFLSTSVNALNSATNVSQLASQPEFAQYDPQNNPMIKYSSFFNLMFNPKTGERRMFRSYEKSKPIQIELGNYNGLKIKGERNISGSNTSLNVRQKLTFDFNALLTRGSIEIMRTEASASSYFFRLNNYTNGSPLPVPIKAFGTGFNDIDFLDKITGYLKGELNRMKTFESTTDVSDTIKKASGGYFFFRDILRLEGDKYKGQDSEALKKKLKAELKDKSAEEVVNDNINQIEVAIREFFTRQALDFYDLMKNKENITAQEIDKDLLQQTNNQLAPLVRAFVANSFILNTEYILLFDGDLVYQTDYKDYFKRAKGDTSTGKTPMTDSIFANWMRNTSSSTMAGFLGASHLNDYKTVRSATITDYEIPSSYHDYRILHDNLKAVNPSLTEDQINRRLEKYSKVNVGDGQGHITLDFYRQFLLSIGNWSRNQEIAYQKEMAWFRINYSHLNERYSASDRAQDEAFLEKHQDTESFFPPLKIQYNGPIQAKGTFAKVLDKFSTAPLIPSMVKGTPWEQIHIDMVKNGIGYSKFTSGTKKYKHPATSMYNNGKAGIDFAQYKPATHFLAYLKEQINTSPKVKEESTFGSQIKKLIFANLFSKGTSDAKTQERFDRYIKMLKRIEAVEKKKLFDEIGLTEVVEDGKVYTRVSKIQKFISQLQTQADLRDLNDNIKGYIQYDKDTKDIKNPLEASLNRAQIQDMIMGIIHRRLVRIKVNGDQLVQVSSAGFEPTGFKYKAQTREEVLQNGTNGLRFYTVQKDENGKLRTLPMQIKVALTGGFERLLILNHPDGNRIGTRERLNQAIKDPAWQKEHQKSLSMVGYRIPTQGPNSIEFMEIAEFLPSDAGSTIILPAEIVTKAGSDYDIDKLFVFRPSFDQDGKLESGKDISDQGQKNFLTNEIIDLFRDVLSDPSMYEQLITPNNTDLIKPVSLQVAVALGKKTKEEARQEWKEGKSTPYPATQVLRYVNHLRKFESLLSAKKLLALFAVNNTFSQLLQQGGVAMAQVYGKGSKAGLKYAKLFLFTPEERKSMITPEGKIDLSNSKGVTGIYKQEFFSQLINGTVDTPTDDFLGYVNLSYENADVVALLINQGAPFDRALWFVNQPVLTRYYQELRANAGIMSRSDVQARIFEGFGEPLLFNEYGKARFGPLQKRIQQIITDKGIPSTFHFSEQYLKDAANKSSYAELYSKANPAQRQALDRNQKILFAYFLSLKDQAIQVNKLRSTVNFDTTKFATPIDVMNSFQNERLIGTEPEGQLFTKEEVDKITTKSAVAPFYNKKMIYQIVQSVMKAGYEPTFLSMAATKIGTIFGKKAQFKASKMMANEFSEFIIKNFGTRNGKPLSVIHQELQSGKNSLARRLIDMKAKYPELAERYVLFQRMKPNFSNKLDVEKIDNIEVQRLFENTTADQNRYIAEFRELINFHDSKFTPAQQVEIQDFFNDVAIYAFLQSGFNKSNISFQELVPQEVLAPIFTQAIDYFKREIKPYPKVAELFAKNFLSEFESYNRRLFWKNATYKPTWRGKDYRIARTKRNAALTALLPTYQITQIEREQLKDNKEQTTEIIIPVEGTVVQPPKGELPAPQNRMDQIRDIVKDVRTFQDYLKGFPVDDVMRKGLIDGYLKHWSENIAEYDEVQYVQMPLDFTDEEQDDMYHQLWTVEDPEYRKKYLRDINNLEAVQKMLQYWEVFGDDILSNEDGPITLDDLFDKHSEINYEVERDQWKSYESPIALFRAVAIGPEIFSDKEMKTALAELDRLGLKQWLGYNPNQLSLFGDPGEPIEPKCY